MFSRMKKLTGTALALILMSSPAFAADINADGAAKLKAVIQKEIDLRKNVQSAAGGSYITEGELKVEPADGYYAVTFPHIKVKEGSGTTFDIGMLAANVIPGDTDKEWKAAIAIPTPLRIINADGTPGGQIDIGKQRALGVWDTESSSFIRLDANYDDIKYKNAAESVTVAVSNAIARTQFNREANGNLSGPASVVVSKIDISAPSEKLHGTIKEARVDVTMKDFDAKVAKSFNEQMGALGQSGQPLVDPTASPEHGLALYNLITTVLGKSSDAFSSKMSFSEAKFEDKNTEDQTDGGFSMGFAAFGFDMSGFRSGSVKTGLQVKFTDFALADKSDPNTDLVPQSFNLDLTVNQLPFQQLVDLGRDAIASSSNPNNMAGMTALMTIPKLLTDAGTNITHTVDVNSPVYKAKGNGIVNANMKAMLGYTSEQNLQFEGLDKLIARLNEEIKTATPEEAQEMQGALGPLTIMQMVGQQDPNNPDNRTYKFVVDEQGKMLLNGSDMSTLMGSAGGGLVPQEPAPETQSGGETSPAQ